MVVALASVAVQQHLTRQQSKAEAKARHCDRTQTLILTALNDPELLAIISGNSEENQKLRRYLQLWLNHIELIYRQRHFFERPHWKGTINDIRDFMVMPPIQEHWIRNRHFYAADFQSFMEKQIFPKKARTPKAEVPAATVVAELPQESIT